MQVKGHKEDVERYLEDRGLKDYCVKYYDMGATGNRRYCLEDTDYVRDILKRETREKIKGYNIGIVVSIKEEEK